ncbi:AAA family ATPase [Nostoc sp. ChiSLP03a]|uniref:AAA family ATPase n=1 Tax=Nostoc sp. ChiSLP03a TaxID=3075380 RepID=UPI002AD554E8|nr:AAA family ATPase [Nostoc sp. ChiSLP03a]MDZ8213589.1 AAA family ATPase [Nostoc sp. ChiSLP03a]
MTSNAVHLLASYVDALRPIIYIKHFDFNAVDILIKQVVTNQEIHEYNDAGGYVYFESKNPKCYNISYDIETFLLNFYHEDDGENFLVLKDIHFYLDNPKVIALLKSIALKTLNRENFYTTIFMVASKLVIPNELENLITVFDIPIPQVNQIRNIIKQFSQNLNCNVENNVIEELALSFKGLSEFEIIQILNLAYQNGGAINKDDKQLIIQEKEQFIKKTGTLEILNFPETINDIGGLNKLIFWLQKKAKVFKNLDQAIKYGVDIPKGILLVGMPGCGKSLVAKATARLFEVPLLRLDIGKLLGKYVGESEENFSKAIKIAEAVSPCILWVDEIEKAFAGIGESGGGSDVTTRLFGNFLTWIQEKENTVFVVATSNDISKFPAEFLRKGRFDELFFVDLPNGEERKKIFEIHLKKRGKYHKNIDIISLLDQTEGYCGADIEAIVKETIENAFIDNKDTISTDDLLAVIKSTESISKSLKKKIEKIRESLSKISIKPAS